MFINDADHNRLYSFGIYSWTFVCPRFDTDLQLRFYHRFSGSVGKTAYRQALLFSNKQSPVCVLPLQLAFSPSALRESNDL
jgi:hypothetical protein